MDALPLGEFHSSVKHDLSLGVKLALVSNQVDTDLSGGVLLDFMQPTPQVVKGLVSGDIIGEEHTVGSSVEDPSY